MYLMRNDTVVRSYNVGLGFQPVGHKQFEGDGKTPEGTYVMDRRNPRSAYHLSVGISYPNPNDRLYAAEHGRSPGGDIFIHGTPQEFVGKGDWTVGCFAVSNAEIEEIYRLVPMGARIHIFA
ncbi:ErfK/YbiS/YcfS/YnhG family protein [Ketogulonicigenium robustum]|uniref:ErfK/YbiS/YcfS/YnhG family protein n=1 Tax=Ketogulonicigenium robustum TaxID=92947 RepID=A0A1W6P2D1_9RHOB|nr:ErfK/YbiS/YcfS/YnhG family protein [Ketogulonicigenium robustum]